MILKRRFSEMSVVWYELCGITEGFADDSLLIGLFIKLGFYHNYYDL